MSDDDRLADEEYGRQDRGDLLGLTRLPIRWPYEPRTVEEADDLTAYWDEQQNAFDDWCDQEDGAA